MIPNDPTDTLTANIWQHQATFWQDLFWISRNKEGQTTTTQSQESAARFQQVHCCCVPRRNVIATEHDGVREFPPPTTIQARQYKQ